MAHRAKREEKKPEGIDLEFGLRPLRAVGSIYEPEAIGAFAYVPAGKRKEKSISDELFAGGTVQAIKIKSCRSINKSKLPKERR